MAGSKIERPHDMTIAADIGRATVAGLTARDVSARVKVDGQASQIDRLSVADLGGAAFSASGRIDATGHAPRGALTRRFRDPDRRRWWRRWSTHSRPARPSPPPT